MVRKKEYLFLKRQTPEIEQNYRHIENAPMDNHAYPLVTILTPVYNGGAYLRECIESILAQTYSNWHYIIINNCSNDCTLEIANTYATKDPRIAVSTNAAFLPIIANHNRAFSLVGPESKYCKIVSADDLIFPECIARMVDLAEAHPSVGIVGSYQLSGGGDEWYVRNYGLPYFETVVHGRDICRSQLLGSLDVFGNPTSNFYRADLVRASSTFFPNETAEADLSACFQALQVADYGFVHQVLSYERLHEDRITTVSKKYMAYISAKLSDCVTYGPSCLSHEELNARIQELLDSYYEYLANSAFKFPDKTFWKYHTKRLREIGYPLQRIKLARGVTARLLKLFLNPQLLAEKLAKRLIAVNHGVS